MIAGVGLFGTFSGFVASWFLSAGEDARETELQQIKRELQAIKEIIRDSSRT
jgi:voltage-gated potassium channel